MSHINFDPDLKARVERAYDPEAQRAPVAPVKRKASFVEAYRARKAQQRKEA